MPLSTQLIIACVLLSLVLPLMSCEEPTDWSLEGGPKGRLVVEAIITNEHIIQEVSLSRNVQTSDQRPLPVNDAVVELHSLDEKISFFPSQEDLGLYQSERIFAARKDVMYTLQITWDDHIYSAQSQLSFVAPLESLVLGRSRGPDSLILAEVAPLYHPLQQAMHEVTIDWQHIDASPPYQARLYYYTFSTVDGSELARADVEKIYFAAGSKIVHKKFGLSDEFAAYLRSLSLETSWQGSLFDEASSSLPTNISNGALGFFSVCAVLSDTQVAQ